MKKTLLTLALVATSVAAFAQGRVTFINDSQHLFVLGNTLGKPADNGLGGGATNNADGLAVQGSLPIGGVLPSGVTLVAGLYSGTSAASLVLQSSTSLLTGAAVPSAGRMAGKVTILSNVPGATTGFFQVAVWDSAFASPELARAGQSYAGWSGVFTAVPSTSAISAPNITPGSPANSTWQLENVVINALPIPEPSTLALAGLGAASLLVFRRRK